VNHASTAKLTRFLATAYQLKATADYGIGPTAAPIAADQAAAAIATASRFIDIINPSVAARLTPPRHFRPSPLNSQLSPCWSNNRSNAASNRSNAAAIRRVSFLFMSSAPVFLADRVSIHESVRGAEILVRARGFFVRARARFLCQVDLTLSGLVAGAAARNSKNQIFGINKALIRFRFSVSDFCSRIEA
jgi:hypothetical protein